MGSVCGVVILLSLLVRLLVCKIRNKLHIILKYFQFRSLFRFSIRISLSVFPRVEECVVEIRELKWISNNFMLILDFYTYRFFIVRFLVTWSILIFANWYIIDEVKVIKFLGFLVLFLFFIFCLTSCGNLLFVLVRWERVRIISFLLISWWLGRRDARISRLQAVIYNRTRDFRIYTRLFLILMRRRNMSIDFDGVYRGVICLLLLLGIVAKSSQFLFHPWLPNAIERPTPVSSLLHSSTIVVAGVYLLIRLNDIFSFYVLQVVFVIGSLTILYRSICAIGQSDIKKIIAFSTTSQLRFIIGILGIRIRILAFIHLCLHAFFKSLIFLTSGYFIHAERDNQDFRIIRIRVFSSKISSVCLLLGSLSLRRFPFLARFYSKDLILENLIGRVLNRIATIILFISCVLTIRYSFRLIIRSLKRVVSISIMPKKVGVEVLGRSIRWNLIRSLLFVVCRRLFVWGQFFFLNEEFVIRSGRFSVVIISLRVLLGILGVIGIRFFRSYWLLFYNPLIHQVIQKLWRFSLERILSFEFFVVESLIFRKIKVFSKIGLLYKKNYIFNNYIIPLILILGLILIILI